MKDSFENLNDGVLSANALTLVSQCECRALKELLREVCAKAQITFADGSLSFDSAYHQLRAEFLQAKLISLEDRNPALAARIQDAIDGANGV